jgi:hypothetical protein
VVADESDLWSSNMLDRHHFERSSPRGSPLPKPRHHKADQMAPAPDMFLRSPTFTHFNVDEPQEAVAFHVFKNGVATMVFTVPAMHLHLPSDDVLLTRSYKEFTVLCRTLKTYAIYATTPVCVKTIYRMDETMRTPAKINK